MDREAEARAIVERAKQARRPTPRWLWTAAIVVSIVCVGAVAIGLVASGGTSGGSHARAPVSETSGVGGGFGLGLLVGVITGIAIGTLIAVRRRG